jgi:hypothetical protein
MFMPQEPWIISRGGGGGVTFNGTPSLQSLATVTKSDCVYNVILLCTD